MAKALSATMAIALADMAEHGGEFVCWKGGFWTYPNCSVKSEERGPTGAYRVPEFYVATNTISALLKRGQIIVTERAGGGYPIRVRLSEENAAVLNQPA